MNLSVKLLESDSVIRTKILDAIRSVMDDAMRKALYRIKPKLQDEVKQALMSEPEYLSLVSGQLKSELGIPTKDKIDNIINLWTSNVSMNYTGISTNARGLSGSLKLEMIRSSFDDVLVDDSAVVVDGVSGVVIPWLEWLLLYGGKIIIRNYRVVFGPYSTSRTGMAIMVESPGDNWRVPPEFAGTISNNWVTRALVKINNQITTILQDELERSL